MRTVFVCYLRQLLGQLVKGLLIPETLAKIGQPSRYLWGNPKDWFTRSRFKQTFCV